MTKKQRAKIVQQELEKLYPEVPIPLEHKDAYTLMVAVALSAQTTDKKVNQVTPHLFENYPDFKTLSKASVPAIEKIIRPINYYKTKAKNLVELAKAVETKFAGQIPHTRNELTSLAGVGQKTSNVVLGELGHEKTFPVDTHVFRLAHRLGLAKGKNPKEVEEELKEQFKPSTWRNLHHWLIFHGRRVCKAQTPLCAECPLAKICPSAGII